MVNSQNGWPANRRELVSARTVRGTNVRLTVRNGPAGDLLLEVAALFDLMVQDVDQPTADDWGYAERPIRGSATISNHASGTAIDLNATRWSLGSAPSVNLNPEQIATVRRIVAATGGVVRWGGDYSGRKDPMHFEINNNRTEAECAQALSQLRAAFGKPTTKDDDVDLTDKLPDYYDSKRPPLTVGDTMAWGTAHAARARDAAQESVRRIDVLASQVAALSQQMSTIQATLTKLAAGGPK
jgi:hypothetical protein